jgi:hypothetical protein
MEFQGAFMVIEREDAVLIPGAPPSSEFQPVTVQLGEGVEAPENIDDSDVILLMSGDNKILRFVRCPPQKYDDFVKNIMKREQGEQHPVMGWYPVGYESVRYYPTYQEYIASTLE